MTTSNSSTGRVLIIALISCIAVLAFVVLRQRSELKKLAGEKVAAAEKETVPPEVTGETAKEPAAEPVIAPVAAAQPVENLVSTPTGMARPPLETGLALSGTHVVPVEGGLKVSMRFNPTIAQPMGLVAIVVRLPVDGPSRILDLQPQGASKFADVSARVAENGKFAVFQGTPEAVEALEFALSVSEPTVADVRGTTGIGEFDLAISATGAKATPK